MGERTITVSSRFSPEEVAVLDERRGKMKRGAYLRNMFFGGKPPRQIPEVNRKAYAESARWAANLNQIARRANVGDVNFDELREVLKGFRQSLLDAKNYDDDRED